MTIVVHPSNAQDNVTRPFNPPMGATDPERVAYALEFIATALARIDHNLELMARHTIKPR